MRWTEHGGRWAAAVVAAASMVAGSCGTTRDAVSDELTTRTEGVLTVAASLPAPAFWQVADTGVPNGGFEWAIADALADRFDLTLDVVDTPFEHIVAGDFGAADMAIAQIEVTAERSEVMDFSIGYLDSDMGVLVRTGDDVRDLASARDLDWVAVVSSTEEQFVRDTISPTGTLELAQHEAEAAALVAVQHADAALVDLVSALVIAADQEALDVTARFVTGGMYAIALPSGSPNRELVDAALRGLQSDGTIDRFEREWLEPAFDRAPDDVPVIRSR